MRWRLLRVVVLAGLAFAILAAFAATPAAAKAVPKLTNRVTDQADMIPDTTERRLEEALSRYEQETGSQVVVLTVESLEGEVLEDYSHRVASENEIGREGVDDGVLLLVAKQDRKLRIEVGYGFEDELTDLEAGRIIRNVITPRFKQGDFGGGVEEGVSAILGTLRDEPGAIPDEPPPGAGGTASPKERVLGSLIFFVVMGVFAVQSVFSKGCQSWFVFVFLMPFFWAFGGALFGGDGGLTLLVGWIFVFLVLKFLLRGTARGRKWVSGSPFLSDLSRWSSSGSGGGGFSSGGFSGGGGSFGGGGASGSW